MGGFFLQEAYHWGMTEHSTNRTLVTIMIIIGIVIIILLLTQGYFGRNTLAYNTGSLYTASALPFNGNNNIAVNNDGYPVIITRTIPSRYMPAPAPVDTASTGSSSTTTTYSSVPAPATTTAYPVTYPATSYQTTPAYSSTPTYTPTPYYPSVPQYADTPYPDTNECPTDTMECPNGTYVGRAGPYCAFTLCQ